MRNSSYPTLDHPSGQRSSVGDPDSHKNKNVVPRPGGYPCAQMGHPVEIVNSVVNGRQIPGLRIETGGTR